MQPTTMTKQRATPVRNDPPKPYHHGALREALLVAAERILERDGIAGLTLRAAAREAGASHAAPKNHFGDLTGLLSELAAVGFNRFTHCLLAAAADHTTPQRRLDAIGRAYVEFAISNPGFFQLIFRGERLDRTRAALRDEMEKCRRTLADAVTAAYPNDLSAGPTPAPASARMVRAWAMVHGYAMLLLDGRLDPILEAEPGGPSSMMLLEAILALDSSCSSTEFPSGE